MSKERRGFARLYMGVEGQYPHSQTGGMCKVLIQNISPAGMRFISSEQFLPETEVPMSLTLPDFSPALTVNGKIVWQRKFSDSFYDTGLEFIALSPELKERLSSYIRQSLGSVAELREFIRCNVSTTVKIRDQAHGELTVVSVDVCPAGIKVQSAVRLEKQSRLAVSFVLPESSVEISADGQVMWSKDCPEGVCEAGIEFDRISEFNAFQINDFVKQTLGIYW